MSRDTELLEEVRDRRVTASADWSDIQDEAKKDRLCVAGRIWEAMDPDGLKQRKIAQRPHIALDELGQYINQTVNDVRANPRGIKFAPTGNGANDDGAEFYQNHTREIEYRSHARVGYATAFENAVTSSYGWLRIRTKREHVRTFNQDIYIDPVVNADQVLPDSNAIWPDSRDMKFLYFIESWPEKEFTRRFPGAKVKSFNAEWRNVASQWFAKGQIHVAEYWKLCDYKRKLVAFRLPGQQEIQQALVDELPGGKLPDGVENIREEDVEDSKVEAWLTNGVELLEEIKWKGKYIPFISCFGKILYVDDGDGAKRKLLSMTRLARDPYLLYCYIRTCQAEVIGMTPKFPYFYYEGQMSPKALEDLVKSVYEPVAAIPIKAFVEGMTPGTALPPPSRNPFTADAIIGLDVVAEAARRAIQAAMGTSPLPTSAQRHNEKSGKALQQMEASGQKGSFHFVDHYDLMIERAGVIVEDLMDKTLDTMRDVPVRQKDDSSAIVTINDPRNPDSVSTKGDYRVTVSTGPADASQREASDHMVEALVSNMQQIAQMAGPQVALKVLAKSIKLKQLGPIGDEIAELFDPPQMGEDGKPLPPQVAKLLGENQQLKQVLQQASQEKQAKVVESKGKFAIAKMQEDAEMVRSRESNETKLAVAELSAKIERLALFLEERARLGAQVHEHMQTVQAQQHAGAMAGLQHEQALEQGQQGVDGQIAVQAASPEPTGAV